MFTRRSVLAASLATAISATLPLRAQTMAHPAFRLFDGHCHLKSEDLKRYPRVASAAVNPGNAPLAGALPGAPTAETPEVERVLKWQDANGVESAAAVQHRGTYGFDNRYILDSAQRYPARFAPVVVLDAEDAATADTLTDLTRTRGLAGTRFTGGRADDGSYPWLNSNAAHATWQRAHELGLAVDLMTTPPGSQPDAIALIVELAKAYPHARIVVDHIAWPDAIGAPDFGLNAAHRAMAPQRNIYYKFTTINLDQLHAAQIPAPAMLKHVVEVFGADHVLWGSDIGNSVGPYARMVDGMLAACTSLSEDEQRQVLRDTGKAVYVRGGRH